MPERQGHVQTARGLSCPLIFERGHLFVTAGNRTFLLDTGAPVSFGRVSSVTLDGQRFTVAPTYLGLTKEVLSSHVGRDVDGLLGADILNQFDMLIDVGHSRVWFSEGPVEVIRGLASFPPTRTECRYNLVAGGLSCGAANYRSCLA